MQDTLLALVDDFKVFFMTGIQTLPLSMAGTLLILGFGTANYPMLFFLVGMLLVAPLIPFLVNLFVADDTWKVAGCGVVPGLDNYVISQWVVMVYFFLGYILNNAISLAQMQPTDAADTEKATLRKSQCWMGVAVIVLCMVAFGVTRVWGCEAWWRFGLTALLSAAGGWGWYALLNTSASGRLADLFGIANRLLSPSAFVNEPVGCVPIA